MHVCLQPGLRCSLSLGWARNPNFHRETWTPDLCEDDWGLLMPSLHPRLYFCFSCSPQTEHAFLSLSFSFFFRFVIDHSSVCVVCVCVVCVCVCVSE